MLFRFDSKARGLVFAVLPLAWIAVGACANGEAESSPDDDADVTSPDGGKGACKCKEGETCKDGKCVGKDEDSDGVPGNLGDCDDSDPQVHPGAPEVCNGKDDDCDGKIDNDVDGDKDGFFACTEDETKLDCDDGDPAIHPGVEAEVCNEKDDDCNGEVDDLPLNLTPTLTDIHWKRVGTATASGDWINLTTNSTDQEGGFFWNASFTFETFDMSAKFKVGNKSEPADGLAFVWLSGTNLALGSGGASFGVGGLTGYGVAIDTYSNTSNPNDGSFTAPFLSVFSAKALPNPMTRKQLGSNLLDGNEHTLRVQLKGGKVTVHVDGTEQLKDYTLSGYTPFAGYWGFAAATGGFTGTHSVKGITMSFPDQGCVP